MTAPTRVIHHDFADYGCDDPPKLAAHHAAGDDEAVPYARRARNEFRAFTEKLAGLLDQRLAAQQPPEGAIS